ncbi:hypothetical protein KKB44_02010 [Candidatus Micrarchaeota archaeon]|nr:hypothetical protein [Candidatus Micrarchaeota archaeon]
MSSKILFVFTAFAVILSGCCCLATEGGSSAFCTGPTYTQSCQKSCNVISSGDYQACVEQCENIFASEGVDPNSCCPYEYTIRYVCEEECTYTDYSGPGTCVENCGQIMYNEMGLSLDDCIVPA